VPDRSQAREFQSPNKSAGKVSILRVPMAGLEPARAYTAQRILSPLRLPFRHIGAAACILSFFRYQ
jgi:hypothetical protein